MSTLHSVQARNYEFKEKRGRESNEGASPHHPLYVWW